MIIRHFCFVSSALFSFIHSICFEIIVLIYFVSSACFPALILASLFMFFWPILSILLFRYLDLRVRVCTTDYMKCNDYSFFGYVKEMFNRVSLFLFPLHQFCSSRQLMIISSETIRKVCSKSYIYLHVTRPTNF